MENISVSVRIRPKQLEEDTNSTLWKIEGNSIINLKSKDIFSYDRVFTPECQNIDIFNETVKENLSKIFKGINVSIFAYGQTCTGKTYTMRGLDYAPGIIPLSLNYIFMKISENQIESNNPDYNKTNLKVNEMKVSYLEIYNESVNDLLDTSKKNLEIREGKKGIFVENLTEIRVDTPEIAFNLVKQGDSNKIIAETKLNDKSSRSHCIFRISLSLSDSTGKVFSATLNLIDLAGSENATKTKCEGVRFQEGSNINKSLLALSNVIQKLSQVYQNSSSSNLKSNKVGYISYRDSKLTRFLQPSLSGNSKTILVCTIASGNYNYSETLNTLLFAARAKNIKTNIKVNEVIDDKEKINNENQELKNRIKRLEQRLYTSAKKTNNSVSHKISSSTAKKTTTTNKYLNGSSCKYNKNDSSNNNLSSVVPEFSMETNTNNNQKDDSIYNAMEKEVKFMKNYILNQTAQQSSSKYHNNLSNNLFNSKQDEFQKPFSLLHSSKKQLFPNVTSITNNGNSMDCEYNTYLSNANHMNNITPSKLNNNSNPWNNSSNKYSNENINNLNTMNSNFKMYNTYNSPFINKYSSQIPINNIYSSNSKALNTSYNNPYMYSSTKSIYNRLDINNSDDIYELKEQNKELKQHFMEALEKKSQQLKNYQETSEKMRRDLEENYLKIRLENERVKEELCIKETDLRDLLTKLNASEKTMIYIREELKLLKENNNNNSNKNNNSNNEETNKKLVLLENQIKVEKENFKTLENEYNVIKEKNYKLLKQNETLASENFTLKTQNEMNHKNLEALKLENNQLKNNVDSYKSEIGLFQTKLIQRKSEVNQLKLENDKIIKKNFNLEYENKIKELKKNNESLVINVNDKNELINNKDCMIKDLQSEILLLKEVISKQNSHDCNNNSSFKQVFVSSGVNFFINNSTPNNSNYFSGSQPEAETVELALQEDCNNSNFSFKINQAKKLKKNKDLKEKCESSIDQSEIGSFSLFDHTSACPNKKNKKKNKSINAIQEEGGFDSTLLHKKRGRKKKDVCSCH